MSYHVKTTLCHDMTTYDISWQPYNPTCKCLAGMQNMSITIQLEHCGAGVSEQYRAALKWWSPAHYQIANGCRNCHCSNLSSFRVFYTWAKSSYSLRSLCLACLAWSLLHAAWSTQVSRHAKYTGWTLKPRSRISQPSAFWEQPGLSMQLWALI